MNHQKFMNEAIKEAEKSFKQGGLPIGSVLVKGDKIIGRSHNQRVQKNNPVAHAEMEALRDAGRINKGKKTNEYRNCVIYSTLAPCFMCSGAIVHFGIKTVVVGENKTYNAKAQERFLKSNDVKVIVRNDKKCYEIMQKFIKKTPLLWKEDLGIRYSLLN